MEWEDEVTVEDAKCILETPLALCVVLDDDEKLWIPKSQVSDNSEVYHKGHKGKLIISEWIAKQKGLY